MRFLTYIAVLLLSAFLPRFFAAPVSSTALSSTAAPKSSHLTSTHFSTHHRPAPTTTRSLQILSQISILTQVRHTHLTTPFPIHTKAPDPPPDSPHQASQKPIAIFFECLGGVAALALILGISRCYYIYRRTPKRDRIAAVLSRHHLERELEELERNPVTLRRSSMIRDPAPPYFPPPPSYAVQHTAHAGPSNGISYAEVATASPPASPASSERSLEESRASASPVAPHPVMTREPNG